MTPEDASGEKFSVDLTDYASQFGVDGSLSAFVVDGAGNQSAALSTNFTAAVQRVITPITATPTSFSSSTGQLPSLSGNGAVIAFEVGDGNASGLGGSEGLSASGPGGPGASAAPGIYTEDLAVGASSLTLVAPGGSDPSLSNDGLSLAYIGADDGSYFDKVTLAAEVV